MAKSSMIVYQKKFFWGLFVYFLLHMINVVAAIDTATTTVDGKDDLDEVDSQYYLKCNVISHDQYLPSKIKHKITVDKATLIEYKMNFVNYSVNPLLQNMTKNYRANKWARVTTAHGQTLLSLAFNYGILSMMTLRFGTTTEEVELVDSPVGCLGEAPEDQKIAIIRRLLARDFSASGPISLVDDERVCHEVIVDVGGYGSFKDRCYYKDPVLGTLKAEDDVDSNFWLTLLYVILVVIKFSLLLFGPSLFISTVMSMAQDNVPYVVKLKDILIKKICIARKGTPLDTKLKFKHIVDLRSQRRFSKLKDSAADMVLGKPTKVKFSQYDIVVDYKRMLTENVVDVGLLDSLFRTICKCKIRSVGPFQQCCKANILTGCPCSKGRHFPWIKLFRKVANALLVILIPFPYYIRLFVFYYAEYDEVMARKDLIARNGLKERYENSMMHYFTPTHPLFITIYVIYGLTACLLAFMSRKQNEDRLLKIIVGAFRDLQYLNWTETLSMLVANLLWPLKRFGLLGFVVGLIYWPIAIPFTIIIAVGYTVPTIYLTIRMIFYSKSAIYERARRRKKNRPYQIVINVDKDMHKFEADTLLEKHEIIRKPSSLDQNMDNLGLDDIDHMNPSEHFKNFKDTISLASTILKYQTTNWKRLVIYVLCAILCVATLYSAVIIMAEVIGCLVEVFVFTIMGIIVNAAAILKYVMLVIMIFIYSCDCFNNVSKKYLKLNKNIFNEVKSRCKEIADVTSMPSHLQENRGFKSQELGEQAEYESPDDIANKPLNHWLINDLCLFIDSEDMPRIPRALFDEVCQIRVAGVPGPVFRGLIEAFESFIKAIIFVLFVFIIVLTFGAVYKVSSTSQTLATMIGGFIPLILKSFISPPSPDVEVGTVSFKSKLDEVIKNFCQKWPMYDLPFKVLTEEELTELEEKAAEKEQNKKDGDKKEDKASNDVPATKGAPTSHALDLVASFVRTDGEAVITDMGTQNNNPSDVPGEKTVVKQGQKSVRIAEETPDDEVDILIYMPDKFDDTWLEEWSDAGSLHSKSHVNSV